MTAKYILGVLALAFLLAALKRLAYDRGSAGPRTRTWLLIAAIFGTVSAWLFWRG